MDNGYALTIAGITCIGYIAFKGACAGGVTGAKVDVATSGASGGAVTATGVTLGTLAAMFFRGA